jgi:predicted dehydrogenase
MPDGATSAGGVTRREAVIAAGVAVQAWAASDAVPFGLIGCGTRGQRLIEHLNRVQSGRLIALCDVYEPNLEKAARMTAAKPTRYSDHRRLLERNDVQAVLIATPLHTHFPIARDALLAGKHVFCEPPLVFRADEIEPLRKLATEHESRVIQVGFERRSSQFYQVARQMASKGMLGEVTEIQGQWNHDSRWTMIPDQPPERNWRLFRKFSGGIAAELASHQIDVANWVFGDTPEFVTGAGSLDWRRDGRDIYDTVSLIFKYPGGRKFTCSYSSTSRHLPYFGGARTGAAEVIIGMEGTIEITLGTDDQPAIGLWFYEPPAAKLTKSEEQKEMEKVAGATVISSARSMRGFPILFAKDQISGQERFLEREMKYARRWLFSKGIMEPAEQRHPGEAQLVEFFLCCRTGRSP